MPSFDCKNSIYGCPNSWLVRMCKRAVFDVFGCRYQWHQVPCYALLRLVDCEKGLVKEALAPLLNLNKACY